MDSNSKSIPKGFKQTDIGLIPEDWDVDELDNHISKPQYGFTESASDKGNVQFLRITDITDFGVDWSKVPYCNCPKEKIESYKLKNNDIVFARIGATTGKSYLINNPPNSIFASYLIRVRSNNDLDSPYLYYFFNSSEYWKQINSNKGRNLKGGVSASILSKLKIPLPPLPEQKKIAHVLSKIQQAIETQEQIIKTTQELKKALMQKLFTEGLNGEPQKQTEIGLIPESWEVVKIKDYCDVKSHSFSFSKIPSIDSKSTSDIKVLAIKVSDMNLPGNEFVLNYSNNEFYLPEKKLAKIKTIPPGSIVFPKRGAAISTNKKRLIKYNTILDPNLIAVIPGSTVDYSFLFCWFQSFDVSTLKDDNPIPQLNKKDVDNVSFPLPKKDIQKRIADIIYKIDESVVQQSIKLNHLKELFKNMLSQLMTGQIRVKDIEFKLEEVEKTAEAVKAE